MNFITQKQKNNPCLANITSIFYYHENSFPQNIGNTSI